MKEKKMVSVDFEVLKKIVLEDEGTAEEAAFCLDVYNKKINVSLAGIKGNTFPHKEFLKSVYGARWDSNNYAWVVKELSFCDICGMLDRYMTLYLNKKV